MSLYRFRFSMDGELVHEADHESTNDLDALDAAHAFAAEFDVEVWDGERFVARVKKGAVWAAAGSVGT